MLSQTKPDIFSSATIQVTLSELRSITRQTPTVLFFPQQLSPNKTKIGSMGGYNTQIMTQKLVKSYLLADLVTLILPFALLVLMISGIMTLTNLLYQISPIFPKYSTIQSLPPHSYKSIDYLMLHLTNCGISEWVTVDNAVSKHSTNILLESQNFAEMLSTDAPHA